jgi:hypothetical protein
VTAVRQRATRDDYLRLAELEPLVDIDPKWDITGPAVLLQANLDGSMWVMLPSGADVLIQPSMAVRRPHTPGVRTTDPATAHMAWSTVNEHGLSAGQLKVLVALRDAGERGLIDHDHEQINGLEQDSAGKRRGELVKKGLVRARSECPSRRDSPRGTPAQVWQITHAGQQALRPSSPLSLAQITTQPRARAG